MQSVALCDHAGAQKLLVTYLQRALCSLQPTPTGKALDTHTACCSFGNVPVRKKEVIQNSGSNGLIAVIVRRRFHRPRLSSSSPLPAHLATPQTWGNAGPPGYMQQCKQGAMTRAGCLSVLSTGPHPTKAMCNVQLDGCTHRGEALTTGSPFWGAPPGFQCP